jgi:hypothetical protein
MRMGARPMMDTEAQRNSSAAASSSCDTGLNSRSKVGTGGAAVEGAGLAVALASVGRVCGVASSCGAVTASPNAPVAACGTSADGFTKVLPMVPPSLDDGTGYVAATSSPSPRRSGATWMIIAAGAHDAVDFREGQR